MAKTTYVTTPHPTLQIWGLRLEAGYASLPKRSFTGGHKTLGSDVAQENRVQTQGECVWVGVV